MQGLFWEGPSSIKGLCNNGPFDLAAMTLVTSLFELL